MNSQYYIAEMNNIFNQLKNKSSTIQDAGTKQLYHFLNKYRENSDEIISKLSQFFNVNSDIPDRIMIKVINIFLKILTENNTQIINFLNLVFPLLFHIILYSNRSIE
jgi:hypothetical protein